MGKGSGRLWGVPLAALTGLIATLSPAMANKQPAGEGQPVDWQLGFQLPVTEVAKDMSTFHDFLMIIITVVTIFVTLLLAYAVWRFRESANPVPSKTSHHTLLEVAWTVVPILILLVMAIPSFRLLYKQYDYPKPDLIIKATGNQWYWSYEYPDHEEMSFDAVMLSDDDLKEPAHKGKPRLLAVDNAVVVPVNKNVEVQVTASDVLHNWTVPSFGVKVDAVPGRLLRTWFKAEKTGIFYGQCSELCGKDHAFMPIEVHVVSQADFDKWLVKAKEEFAAGPKTRDFAKTKAKEIDVKSAKVDLTK